MHGLIVDFVSPSGGPVSFSLDADETDPPGMVHYTIKYEGFRQKADRTLQPESGGIVGGGGQGPASLGNVKLANGRYLVAGKRVTCLPNSSEQRSKWSKSGSLLPFRVEDRLRDRGALFVSKEELPDKHDVVIDSRIVTAMFLPSSAVIAQEMVNLMK